MPRRVVLAALALAVTLGGVGPSGSAPTAHAQSPSAAPWTEHVLDSTTLGESRRLLVATPADYSAGTQRHPVLLLLDADDRPQVAAAIANIEFLVSRGAVPPMIVVGVANGKDRVRDMTPVATGTAPGPALATAGGAARFTAFLVDEVLADVRARYRTSPVAVLAGHSLGGLLVLHAAATRPDAFTGVIAMSPSLWWNDTTAAVVYADSIAQATRPPKVFATSGALEPPIDAATRRFAARLDSLAPPDLTFAYRGYPDDNHGLTPVRSLMDGLRFVFEPVSLVGTPLDALGPTSDSAAVMNAYVATRDRYARGARSLGLPEALPEGQVNQLGYAVLQFLRLPRLAVWLFRQNVARYPDSPNVHDSLGDGLLAVGDSTGARSAYREALAVAQRTGQPSAEATRQKLAALESAARRLERPR